MAYEVTATRKRPQNFDQLVGQDFAVATLKASLEQGRIAHAYLFSGPRGVGKTSAARILARALNCESGPTATPCGRCVSCQEITRGSSLDVIEIDGASNTSVNDVREIKDEVLFAPNGSRYKIYIIDEVHMLSNSAFNALLKTIEEPPPYIVFVFATTEIHRVPATIRSRCQQFNFRMLSIDTIKACLVDVCRESGRTAEDAALLWISKEATGSLRDAYTLLDQVFSFAGEGITLEQLREKLGIVGLDEMNALAATFLKEDAGGALEVADRILSNGVPVEQFVIDLVEYFRSVLFLQQGLGRESLLGYPPESFAVEVVQGLSPVQVEHAIGLLLELHRNLRHSLNPRFELELLASRLARIRTFIPPEEILERLQALRASLGREAQAPVAGQGPAAVREDEEDEDEEGELELDQPRRVVEALRRDKLALASAMDKASGMELAGGMLRLTYLKSDRYSGDVVTSERVAVEAAASSVLARKIRVEVVYAEQPGKAARIPAPKDEKVEIVKRVFKGQVLEGE